MLTEAFFIALLWGDAPRRFLDYEVGQEQRLVLYFIWRQTDRARPKGVALALSIYAVYRATKKVKDSYERK